MCFHPPFMRSLALCSSLSDFPFFAWLSLRRCSALSGRPTFAARCLALVASLCLRPVPAAAIFAFASGVCLNPLIAAESLAFVSSERCVPFLVAAMIFLTCCGRGLPRSEAATFATCSALCGFPAFAADILARDAALKTRPTTPSPPSVAFVRSHPLERRRAIHRRSASAQLPLPDSTSAITGSMPSDASCRIHALRCVFSPLTARRMCWRNRRRMLKHQPT